ncbi:hypothetical protein CQY23_03245 [Mycobacterium celatum]|uniref:Uncharacterized protein n=1 Tax=Mycobacterium celatum TaxID=28045 RepID=A0A2G5PQR3_MYCCE|nr:hypothetical protein CQY23_03245 [Mycobacterium celatum]
MICQHTGWWWAMSIDTMPESSTSALNTTHGGLKFTPNVGAISMLEPGGTYSLFGFRNGASALPSRPPSRSTRSRTAPSTIVPVGPVTPW